MSPNASTLVIRILTGKNHIEYIYGKLLRLVGIFHKIRNKLPLAVLKMIYFAFVHSHTYTMGLSYTLILDQLIYINY